MDSLPNLIKWIKFGDIVQSDKLHKTLNYLLSAVIPFKQRFVYEYIFEAFVSHIQRRMESLDC